MPQVRCSILVTIIVLSSLCTIVVQTHPMTKHTNNFKRSHNTASLLEETKSLKHELGTDGSTKRHIQNIRFSTKTKMKLTLNKHN